MELNKDFKEFVKLLNDNQVEYLTIGGYAVAYHGFPRYTGDIDFLVGTDKQNAQKILNVLNDFGFGGLNLTIIDFTNVDNVIQLGFPPCRIDILTTIEGLDFQNCFNNRDILELEDLAINFIDFSNLLKAKEIANRPKDKIDIQELKKLKK